MRKLLIGVIILAVLLVAADRTSAAVSQVLGSGSSMVTADRAAGSAMVGSAP